MTKTKVIALNTIIRTTEPGKPGDKNAGIAPTPPRTVEIAPGTHFMLDREDNEYMDLKATGAIRDYTKDDAAAFAQFTNVLNSDPAAIEDDNGTASVKTTEKKAKTAKKTAATDGNTAGDTEDDDGKDLV